MHEANSNQVNLLSANESEDDHAKRVRPVCKKYRVRDFRPGEIINLVAINIPFIFSFTDQERVDGMTQPAYNPGFQEPPL